jgi:predicted acetyltransferase
VNVELLPARPDEIAALFQLYVHDLSEMLGIDVEDDGRFRVRSLDNYWSDPRCHAFAIRAEGKLAGFALVQQRSRLTGDESVTDMAEFFVLRRWRRRGVGERAAAWLFEHFRGRWEVRQKRENTAATAFWRRAIGRYARYDEVVLDDERWRGPVQRFES